MEDEALGASIARRVRTMARLRSHTRWINGLAGALALAVIFFRGGWSLYAWTLGGLCLAPWLALLYVRSGRGHVNFDRRQGSAKPSVAIACILPSLALVLRGFLDWAWLGAPSTVFWVSATVWAAALTVFASRVAPDLRGGNRGARASLGLFALFATIHGLGAAAFVNGRFDAPGATHEGRVVGARETKGKHPEFYLRVGPGLRGESESELRVGRDLFRRTAAGDTVIVVVYAGRLGASWYRVEPASASAGEGGERR